MIFDDSENPWDDDDNSTDDSPRQEKTPRRKTTRPNRSNKNGDPIIDMMNKFQQKMSQQKRGGIGGGGTPPDLGEFFNFKWIMIALSALIVIYFASGVYRIQEGELGLVLRFGKMVRIEEAGLRYHMPKPIEQVIVKNVAEVNKVDSSLLTSSESDQTLILTGDENMVHTNYTVLWKVKDISKFVFTSSRPVQTIRVASESAVCEIFGKTNARLALTEGREQIAQEAQSLLQKILDSYNLGVHIVTLQLQRVEPPAQVIEAFLDMQASRVDADRLSNEAEGYSNDILPRSRGKAEKLIQEAEAYLQAKVLEAQGEAARFISIVKVYQQKPQAVKRYIYNQAVSEILKKVKNKTIVDGKIAGKTLPLFNLDPKKGAA